MLKEVYQAVSDTKQKLTETLEVNSSGVEASKRKQGRGRGNSVSGRGRNYRVTDQAKNQMISSSNGQVEKPNQKVCLISFSSFQSYEVLFFTLP